MIFLPCLVPRTCPMRICSARNPSPSRPLLRSSLLKKSKVGDRFAVEDSLAQRKCDVFIPWKRSILVRTAMNSWDLMDEWGDVVRASPPHSGKRGVIQNFDIFYREPSEVSVEEGMLFAQETWKAAAEAEVGNQRAKRKCNLPSNMANKCCKKHD